MWDMKGRYVFILKFSHEAFILSKKVPSLVWPILYDFPTPSPLVQHSLCNYYVHLCSIPVQFKLKISHLKSLDLIHDANLNSRLKMIFQQWYLCFLYQNPVSVITWFTTNDHKYYHDATRNNPATVELRFRPSPQSNTIHPDEFKRFKLVVALSWRLPNHQESSRITTVLLGFAPMSLRCCYDSCRCITTW